MRIAFIGNFGCEFSTESHHKRTWEKLGHEVIILQEDRTSAHQILDVCKNADLLQWTHTHTWSFPGENEIIPENIKIPSFSYHLDRYIGIGSRQSDYLQHPSFHLDYFFSTDGGNDMAWRCANINHHWLLPGCVSYGCHYGVKSGDIPVLFTGSTNYHGEHPFRPRMVAALQANYGDKFQVRTGVREEALNDLFASAKVCVGDHIFAGCEKYCSDRLFETVGRGGFIIYPETRGITENIPGLVTYRPQDENDLISKIDYFLDTAHEQERIERRDAAFNYVKQHGTYTNRLSEILQIIRLV